MQISEPHSIARKVSQAPGAQLFWAIISKNFWGTVSSNEMRMQNIVSPLYILPLQKHKYN